jgi:hypothetical protein
MLMLRDNSGRFAAWTKGLPILRETEIPTTVDPISRFILERYKGRALENLEAFAGLGKDTIRIQLYRPAIRGLGVNLALAALAAMDPPMTLAIVPMEERKRSNG